MLRIFIYLFRCGRKTTCEEEAFDQRKRRLWLDSTPSVGLLGLKDITALLLEFDGSSALILDKDRKMTPLLMAASQGHKSLAGTIIAHCPECYDLVDNRGWNVLHFLTVSLHESKLKRLLKDPLYKSFVDEKDEKGNTPLHVLATLSARTCNEIVRQIGKGDTQAVNKKKISVKHIELYGSPELQVLLLLLFQFTKHKYFCFYYYYFLFSYCYTI